MSITWQEREHEEQDIVALNDLGTIEAFRNYGLLKYFKFFRMRQQLELLQFFVHTWDPIYQAFHIRGKVVAIMIDDVYFLTGLSRHGAPISLSAFACGGELVRDYIQQFFLLGTQPSRDGKIKIMDVHDFPLRKILFTITKLASNVTLHLVNRSYMQYALKYLEPTVFNWCEAILSLMKEQMTKVKSGRMNNFSYGSLLITFTLERIPLI